MSEKPVGFHISSDPDETRVEQPETQEAREAVQLPLRLLLAADLVPQQNVDWTEASLVHSVDKHRFADVMRALEPRLDVEMPNRLGDAPQLLETELSFSSLDDFRPGRLARQVSPLKRVLEVRELVSKVRSREIDLPAFRDRLTETGIDQKWAGDLYQTLSAPAKKSRSTGGRRSSRPKEEDDDALGRLMGMVDAGDDAADEPEPQDLVDTLMEAASGASRPKTKKDAADVVIADLDATIGRQLNELIGHPAVRRLEAAWRGLKFLVDRIDFRADIELDVLPAGKAELDEALYHQVLLPEHREETERAPLSAIVVDFAFDKSSADVALLGDLAETAGSLQVPVLGSVAPAFFGVETPEGLARLPLLWQHLERPEYLAWNKLRAREEAKHLALVLPAFLLRYPYGSEHPVDAFDFDEDGLIWGGGALITAAAIADSFAKTGSPTHVAGRSVEDLPLSRTKAGTSPLAALLPTSKQRELAEAGFVVLTAQRDAARVAHAPSVWRVPSLDDAVATKQARIHASLTSQLFVSRAAHVTMTLQRQLRLGVSVTEAREEVARRLRRWLRVEGEEADEAVHVEHRPDAELPNHELLAVRLQPPSSILEHRLSLVLGVHVPKGDPDAV